MKKILILTLALVLLLGLAAIPVMAAKPDKCTTIQDGVLTAKDGTPLTTGYDQYGYNYQAHIFNGFYGNASRPATLATEGTWLVMKWNNAWMSNKSCDGDLLLDRHYGYDSYIGSGAWCTNHQWGSYLGDDGKMHKWTYFVKIVAVPTDATKVGGIWYTAANTEIGPDIWGAFAIIQSVYNDPYDGYHGAEYISPSGPGLGKW
jgi:hypothetical protein